METTTGQRIVLRWLAGGAFIRREVHMGVASFTIFDAEGRDRPLKAQGAARLLDAGYIELTSAMPDTYTITQAGRDALT